MSRIALAVVLLLAVGAAAYAADQPPAAVPNPFAGTYSGAFAGDISGDWTLQVAADGTATGTATSSGQSVTLKGQAAATGEVWMSGSEGAQMGLAAGLLRKVDGQVVGNGAWIVSQGMKGTWTLGKPPAAVAPVQVAALYEGTFTGIVSGTVAMKVAPEGAVEAIFTSSEAGPVTVKGALANGQVSLTGNVEGTEVTAKGTLNKDGGSGTWEASGYNGEWTVKPAAPAPAAAPQAAPVAPAGNAFAGSYTGTFDGAGEGTVSLKVAADGTAEGTFTHPQVGGIAVKGTVGADGKTSLTGTVMGQEFTATGAFNCENGVNSATGDWSAASYSGTWKVSPAK